MAGCGLCSLAALPGSWKELGPAGSPGRSQSVPSSIPCGFRSILSSVPSARRKARWGSISHLAKEGIKPQRGEVCRPKPQSGSQPVVAHGLLAPHGLLSPPRRSTVPDHPSTSTHSSLHSGGWFPSFPDTHRHGLLGMAHADPSLSPHYQHSLARVTHKGMKRNSKICG